MRKTLHYENIKNATNHERKKIISYWTNSCFSARSLQHLLILKTENTICGYETFLDKQFHKKKHTTINHIQLVTHKYESRCRLIHSWKLKNKRFLQGRKKDLHTKHTAFKQLHLLQCAVQIHLGCVESIRMFKGVFMHLFIEYVECIILWTKFDIISFLFAWKSEKMTNNQKR